MLGSVIRCPDCSEKFNAEISDQSDEELVDGLDTPSTMIVPSETTVQTSGAGSAGTDVGVLKTGLIGIVATLAIRYLVVVPLAESENAFTQVAKMFADGWVPTAIVFLSTWSMAILALKLKKVMRQRSALLYDLLPREIDPMIRQDNVGEFITHVHSLPCKPEDSFLLPRILRGLEHFGTRGSLLEVSSLFSSQDELDADSVESSYSMLKVFIWAVPILGFIGTVIGIGDAVGTFSSSIDTAQEIDSIKGSLGGVTSGLGVAFDTTLIALVCSILLMVPTNWLKKLEGDILNAVSDYCNEEFLRRLLDSASPESFQPQEMGVAVTKMLDGQQATMEAWQGRVAGMGEVLAEEMVKGWRRVNGEMNQALEQQSSFVQENVARSLATENEKLEEWTAQLRTESAALQVQAQEHWESAHTAWTERAHEDARQLREIIAETRSDHGAHLKAQAEQHSELLGSLELVSKAMEQVATETGEGRAAMQAEENQRLAQTFDLLQVRFSELQQSAMSSDSERAKLLEESAQQLRTSHEEVTASAAQIVTNLGQAVDTITNRLSELAEAQAAERAGQAEDSSSLRDALTIELRELTSSFEKAVAVQKQGLESESRNLQSLTEALRKDLPESLNKQATAFQNVAKKSSKLVDSQSKLLSQIELVTSDRLLMKTLLSLEQNLAKLPQTLDKLEGRMAADARRGQWLPAFLRNGSSS
jgi:biopolymer transport protein ExbB/TolQ